MPSSRSVLTWQMVYLTAEACWGSTGTGATEMDRMTSAIPSRVYRIQTHTAIGQIEPEFISHSCNVQNRGPRCQAALCQAIRRPSLLHLTALPPSALGFHGCRALRSSASSRRRGRTPGINANGWFLLSRPGGRARHVLSISIGQSPVQGHTFL